MKPSDKIMLKDYVQSRERKHPPQITETSPVVRRTKAVLAYALALLAVWLLWEINSGTVAMLIGGW